MTSDLNRLDVDNNDDITKLSFDDDSFDLIYCSNVLEHVENDRQAMLELHRVLAPGGQAIIQVPIKGKTTYEDATIVDPGERYKHFGQADHVRYYGEDIANRLSDVSFKVTPFYMLDVLDLSDQQLEKMNLNKRELIHKCEKI